MTVLRIGLWTVGRPGIPMWMSGPGATLGVHEHSRNRAASWALTTIVDLTRERHGHPLARLLDALPDALPGYFQRRCAPTRCCPYPARAAVEHSIW